ncbi:copper chaperone PCu(A)C [Diaphorobacter caeni]|uniref:copper chaperone PCu(A)C n=1 Tax=Diaphorobacter caeni TaxID=2784387 RepID=UPI001E4A9B64|nr:copper chaperone PCu(A)C [Diaphorobacter caeni]
MKNTSSALTIITALLATAAAHAHVVLPAGGANVGSPYDAAFRVGHACKDTKATTAIEVELPKTFQFKEAVARSGWKLSAPATGSQGGTVRWEAESAATALPDSEKAAFVVRGVLPSKAQTLHFPVHQICDTGRADWVQIPTSANASEKPEFPAARLEVLPDTVAAVDVRDAWVRAAVPGQSGTGAFVTLQAPQGAKLVAVKSAAAGVVEIHEMKLENDVMKMRAIPALDLPAGEPVKLAPGGLHLMMMDLKQPITAGRTLGFTLTLEDANGKRRDRQIEAPVRAGAAAGNGEHGAHQHH